MSGLSRMPDAVRDAILRIFQGEPLESVATELGISSSTIQDWMRQSAASATQASTRTGSTLSRAEERQYAGRLLASQEIFDVLNLDQATEDLEADHEGYDLDIIYYDLATLFEDLIVASVEVLSQLPGVTRAVRDDRELIRIEGSIGSARVGTHLSQWWNDQLHKRAGT